MKNKMRTPTNQAMFSPIDEGQFGLSRIGSDSQIQIAAISNNLESIINKLGGIDNILSKIEKAQKLVQSISPFLPILVTLLKKKKRIPAKLNRIKRGKRHIVKKTMRPTTNSHTKNLFRPYLR